MVGVLLRLLLLERKLYNGLWLLVWEYIYYFHSERIDMVVQKLVPINIITSNLMTFANQKESRIKI